jgi:hypothetical protein
MTMAKTLIVVALFVAALAAIFLQREEKRRLARELALVREQIAQSEPAQAGPRATQLRDEGMREVPGDVQSELLRLRGAVSRAARAEAEVAQLRKELERQRTLMGGNADMPAPTADTLATYIGAAVQTPANLDAAYTREGLSSAIQLAAQKAGVSLKKLVIEDSEFPFLTGVTSDPGDWEKLKAQLKGLDGYEFNGSVGDDTSHTFSIVPAKAYPPEDGQRIPRRLTLRLQLFHNRLIAPDN